MAQHVSLPLAQPAFEAAYSAIATNGLDGAADALRILVNEACKIQRSEYLAAKPYERTQERVDYANGYKPKTVLTRVGEITFEVPQVRGANFYPDALERGCRSEQALNLALAEMYVQGVSTRKVIEILQKLCGPELSLSSTQVSRCTQKLDSALEAWRTRPLGATPYLIFDARYEKIRDNHQIVDCAVLVAIGIDASGKRRILGVSVALSEAEVHWRDFLQSLVQRGLCGTKLIASDDHAGLRAARKAVFPSIPWQRCQFHLQRNAQARVSRLDQRKAVGQIITNIFNAGDEGNARMMLAKAVKEWQNEHPKLSQWAEENLEQGFTVFAMPEGHRRRLRTTNGLERLNRELKRRTRVATLFPNAKSCERLVSALLAEQDETWLASITYLTMTP